MEELIDALVELFEHRKVAFHGPDAAHRAQEMQSRQVSAYNQLHQALQQLVMTSSAGSLIKVPTGSAVEPVINWARNTVSRSIPTLVTEPDGSAIVSATYPLIAHGAFEKFIERVKQLRIEEVRPALASATILGAICVEFQTNEVKFNIDSLPGADKSDVITGQAFYAAGRIIARHKGLDERYRERVAHAEGLLANAATEFAKERDDQRGAIDALIAAVTDVSGKNDAVNDLIDKTKQDLLNFEKTIRAELELDRARLSWGKRYTESRNGFRASIAFLASWSVIGLLAAFLFGPDLISFIYRPSLYSMLPGSAVGAVGSQLGRLVLVTFIIGIFLWVMRLGVRFFMRSMLLMDDARQRETMLDTYFLLSSNGRADEADRPLVLWALFRQTPGHGPDGIEPPDFTEVITAGMKRAGFDKGVGG